MLAEKIENEDELELLPHSILHEAIECVKELLGKYKGASITQDLVTRIALEAFVRGRVSVKFDSLEPLDARH